MNRFSVGGNNVGKGKCGLESAVKGQRRRPFIHLGDGTRRRYTGATGNSFIHSGNSIPNSFRPRFPGFLASFLHFPVFNSQAEKMHVRKREYSLLPDAGLPRFRGNYSKGTQQIKNSQAAFRRRLKKILKIIFLFSSRIRLLT